jgi:hypothetical protein
MKSIRITGLCLVAMFAMSMAAAATASAEAPPVWKQCREAEGTGTKWENDKCSKIGSPNKWEWVEIKNTEKVFSTAALRLEDTEVLLTGRVAVECLGTDTGVIGPGKYDRVQTVTVVKCKNIERCEEGSITAAAVNLPWQTELYLSGIEQRNKISEGTAKLQPGWAITCKTPLARATDTCLTVAGREGSTLMTDIQASGIVQAEFETKSGSASCSAGNSTSGHVWGVVRFASPEYAIQVS